MLNSTAEAHFKQMAVILLKKAIFKHFEELSEGDALILRSTVLKIYFESNLKKVKSILANLISDIADFYFTQEKVWPELLIEISNRSESNNVEALKDALLLLRNLLDGNEDELESSYPQILEFLNKNINSSDPEVVMEDLKCLSFILGSLDKDDLIKKYGYLFQVIMSTFDTLNKPGVEEDMYFIILDLITHLAQANSKMLDQNKSRELLQYFISEKGLKSTFLHINIKDAILSMLNVLSQHKRTFFTKNKDLVEQLTLMMVQFMLQSKDVIEDDFEVSLGFTSIKLFESLATNLPKKMMKPIMIRILAELYKSKEEKQLIAMYFIYSAISSGLQDVLKAELPRIMKEEIDFGLNHSSIQVKNAAIKAVSYFSEFMLPEIFEYTSTVLPALTKAMDSDDIDLVEHSVFVMDVFVEHLEDDVVKDYLPLLVPKMITMITHPRATYRIRKFAVDALCSLMNAGKKYFSPYLEQSYLVLKEMLQSKDEDVKLAFGAAFSCLGKLLTIVCEKDKSLFSQFLEIHNFIISQVDTEANNFELIEGVYTFLYQAVEVLGEEYGQEVMSKTFNQARDMIVKENIVRKTSADGAELEDDDEANPQDFILVNLDQAKAAALHFFGQCASFAPFSFEKFEKEVRTLLDGTLSFDERESSELRQQTLVAIKGILVGKIKRLHNGHLPPFRKNWTTPAMPEEIMDFFTNEFFMKFEFFICNEPNKENVCLAIEAFYDALKETGPAVLKNDEEHLIKIVQTVTSFDIACFDKGDEDQEDQESDGKIFMALVDLLITISDLLKKDSIKILSGSLPGIFELVEKGNVFELDEFLGGYCDMVENCPEIVGSNADIVTDMIYESPMLNDPLPVRNGCFLLGTMHEHNPTAMEPYVPKSLEFYMKVHQTFQEPEVKDNVVAGIIRVYSVDKKGLVPEEKLVETIIHSYPFVGDKSENPTIALFGQTLLVKNPALFAKNLDALVKIFLDIAAKADVYKIKDGPRAQLKDLLVKLSSDAHSKAAMEAAIAGLDTVAIARFLA